MTARAAALALALAAASPPVAGHAQAPLFGADTALAVTIRTDLRSLKRDRDTLTAPWRAAAITYAGPDGPVTVPLQVKSRGGYRLTHCDFPPVRLRFADSAAHGTLMRGLRRPKLVAPCRDDDEYQQYLLEEYAIYRMLRLFTPLGFATRLVRVTWEDSGGPRRARPVTHYAIVVEDVERLAARSDATVLAQIGTRIGIMSRPHTALLGVFQYFIGNTDWSAIGLHNIVMLRVRDTAYAVPFDFDWSGAIATPYARPAPILPIRSVRERVFRGFCQPPTDFDPVLDRFVALRDTIAALYHAVPGLSPRSAQQTLRYYDEFYDAVRDRPRFMRRVIEPDCHP